MSLFRNINVILIKQSVELCMTTTVFEYQKGARHFIISFSCNRNNAGEIKRMRPNEQTKIIHWIKKMATIII